MAHFTLPRLTSATTFRYHQVVTERDFKMSGFRTVLTFGGNAAPCIIDLYMRQRPACLYYG